DFERLDVAFGPAHVALRGEARVGAAIEDGALAFLARGQTHHEFVADADAVDVGLLDIGAYPEVVRVDQRYQRLSGVDDFAEPHRADIDDAVDRRVDFGVGQAHVRLGLLRLRGGALVLVADQGAALHGDLFGVGAGQRDRRALRFDLFV